MSDRLLKESDVLDAILGWETDPLDEELERAVKAIPSADRLSATEIMNAYYEGVRKGIAEAHEAGRPQEEWIIEYNGNGWNDYWDYTCPHCGKKYERADAVLYKANFCPNCGAQMKGESTDIDCFDTCKHAYSEVCDECYKGNKYDAMQTDCKDTSCPYFKNPDYSRCMECKSHMKRSKDE